MLELLKRNMKTTTFKVAMAGAFTAVGAFTVDQIGAKELVAALFAAAAAITQRNSITKLPGA